MITGMVTDSPRESADSTGPSAPPGPWRWTRLDPGAVYDRQTPGRDAESGLDAGLRQPAGDRGWGLVDAEGNPILTAAGGWASPELPGGTAFSPEHPVAQLLARAGEIPQLEAALAAAQARIDELAAAHAEAVTWSRLLADTFGLPARTGLGPPPGWLLGRPEQP
jgi:hypothetical protein